MVSTTADEERKTSSTSPSREREHSKRKYKSADQSDGDSSDSSSSGSGSDDEDSANRRRRHRGSRYSSRSSRSSRAHRRSRSNDRSRSRSRSRERRPRDRDRDRDRRRDRDRDRDYRNGRDRGNSSRDFRPRDFERDNRGGYGGHGGGGYRDRRPHGPPVPKAPLTAAELLLREQEQIDRDQRTVFASQIHPKVSLREIFEFFSQVGCVRDVQCIQDQRARKFKGMAYIEMDTLESVPLALALNGHQLNGYPVTVQLTQAEKNRAAQQAAQAAKAISEQPMRVRVTQLHPDLSSEDLQSLFEPFGTIDAISIDQSGSSNVPNAAWVTFRRAADAQHAASELNLMELLDHSISVTMEVPLDPKLFEQQQQQQQQQGPPSSSFQNGGFSGGYQGQGQLGELDDDSGGGLHMSAQSRMALMQRLQRSQAVPAAAPQRQAPPPLPTIQRIQETTCVVLKNMFTRVEVEQDPDLALDIKEDVEEEAKKYGNLLHIHVDKDSEGHVFLRYDCVEAAKAALKTFHNRWFASRQILAEFVVEPAYDLRFPGSGGRQ